MPRTSSYMDTVSLKNRFIKAYETHSDALFRYCLWKLSDRETALDITQESFMRLWDEMVSGEKIENERALLYTIARRLVIDHYRKKKTISLEARAETFEEEPFDAPDESMIGQTELSSEARLVRDKLSQLLPEYRQPVYLRFIEGLQPKEIAEVLGISANLAGVRIDRGLKELRKLIDPKN